MNLIKKYKFLIYVGLASWLTLAGFSVVEYPGILDKTCYWQLSFLFCSPEIGTVQKIILFAVYFLVFSIFVVYGRACWHLMENSNAIESSKWFYVSLIADFLVLAALVVPLGSGDMNYYYNSGRDTASGYNVYAQDWPLKNELSYSSSESLMTSFAYGPIMASLFKIVYGLTPNINFFVMIWKIIVIFFFYLCAWAIIRLVKSYNLGLKENDLYLLWFLHPLLLFEWVVNGHFDSIWLFFVLLAFILARKKLWEFVIPCLVIGIWIKFIPIFIMPWFALWWWQELEKFQWKRYLGQALLGLFLGAVITYFAWRPYWVGPGAFNSMILQSKWVVSSYFGLIYYSLLPLFKWFLAAEAHWYLTRLVHLILFVAAVYLLYPYFKKVIQVILKRARWEDFEFYQAIFLSLFIFLFVWQKSFWPWYVAWLLPVGLLLYLKYKNIFLKKIIIWISLAPLVIYPVWIFVWKIWKIDVSAQLWFWYFYVLTVSAYPLFNLVKWRKLNYKNDVI